MKAVIMAGGEGTRLRPLTARQPKPMLPIANRPIMEHVVCLLKSHGIEDIVVTVAYLAEIVRNHFGDGSDFGVNMVYAAEDLPLGTAGSVANAKDKLTEPFVVISGDVLTDVNLTALINTHNTKGAIATIALKEMENPLEFGIVTQNADGSIERFLEKPTWGQVFSDAVNAGIYVLDPKVFDYIPDGRPSDFASEVFPELLQRGEPVFGHVLDGYWEDVSTVEAYLRTHYDVLDGKAGVEIPGFRLENGVWLGEGAEIDPEAHIGSSVVIGPGTSVAAGARLGSYTVLGSNVRIGECVDIERSVVHDNTYLGSSVRLRGTVLGRSVDLRRGVRCEEGVVVGDETFVGEHALISNGVRIYPSKEVEHGAVVNSSIVWETRGVRNLFGRLGVSGLANVDITPELALRVAMAFASTIPKGSTVSVSRDSSRAARSVARAMTAGLNAAGVNVLELEVSPVPVTRFHVRQHRSVAAVTARLMADDPQSVIIRFFDQDGHDIDPTVQRKVERLFNREEFRRVAAYDIGDITFQSRAVEHYTAALADHMDLDAIRASRSKLVLDYAFGSTSFVMPNVLSKLNAEVLTVNPYASTAGQLQFDRHQHAAQVAALVQASGSQLGVVFDTDGERIVLIDDSGHVLTDEQCNLALLTLVGLTKGSTVDPPKVALPVCAPRAAEDIARRYGLEIVWTKLAISDLMERASENDVVLGSGVDGGFLFPRFLPAYDAMCTLVDVLGMLARTGRRLSEIVGDLPRVHIAHETVPTQSDDKGHVMRTLSESIRGSRHVMIDGIKIVDDETWALIVPDPEWPVTHVWAEGPSGRDARTLAQQYVRQLRQAMRSG